MDILVLIFHQSWPGRDGWLLAAWLRRWSICSVAPVSSGQPANAPHCGFTSTSTQQCWWCSKSSAALERDYPENPDCFTSYQIMKYSPRMKLVVAMSGGDCIGEVWVACGQERSPRSSVFSPSDSSLSASSTSVWSLHCNGAEPRRDTIGQTVRNSGRFGKQKHIWAESTGDLQGEQRWYLQCCRKSQNHALSALVHTYRVTHSHKETWTQRFHYTYSY